MLNDPYSQATLRQPRGLVLANGAILQGWVSFSVDNNSFYQADTFRISLAISAQAKENDLVWWASQTQIQIELFAGIPPDPENYTKNDLTSLLLGYVDDIEIDLVAQEIVLSGRDLTSKLIDTKRSKSFIKGQKAFRSSDFVAEIAAEVGLNPVIPVPTDEAHSGGGYYQIVKSIVEANTTYWDIVSRLAQISKYVAYVKGSDLYFEPRDLPADNPYVLQWQPATDEYGFPLLNAARIRFSRNLSIAKDIKVRVISSSKKQKKDIVAEATKTRARNRVTKNVAHQDEPPQEYVYTFADLTQDQAQARANAILADLSQHEMNLHADMPADLILTARTPIRMVGTGTLMDQLYYPSSIVRTMSMSEGFRMDVSAKNKSADVEMS